jgi:hypothetical protein
MQRLLEVLLSNKGCAPISRATTAACFPRGLQLSQKDDQHPFVEGHCAVHMQLELALQPDVADALLILGDLDLRPQSKTAYPQLAHGTLWSCLL